jgi:hypothetical protein
MTGVIDFVDWNHFIRLFQGRILLGIDCLKFHYNS